MITTRRFAAACAALTLGLFAACKSSPFDDASRTISAEIVTGDTTMMVGEQATFIAIAQYGFGPGIPDSVVWSSSDSDILTVVLQGNGRSGFVTARGAGQAWVHAVMNVDFQDSALVTVVGPGEVRFRTTIPSGARIHAAIGSDSLVRLLTATGTLFTVERAAVGTSSSSCNGAFGPSLDVSNGAFATGDECLIRHSAAGGPRWQLPLGDPEGGVAVAADEAAIVLHSIVDGGGATGAVVVSRVSSLGTELWRDTLRAVPQAQRSAAGIAVNGDIYVPWRPTADSGRLARITQAGAVRWDIPLPAGPRFTSPTPDSTRVIVTYLGGITAFDSAGGVLWSRQFTQDNPAATDSTAPSSAVLDRAGRVFVQTAAGLHAYSATGTPLWAADSLGAGAQAQAIGVGAPTVLTDSTVVVVVGGSRVCGVRPGLGVPRWCGPALGPGDVVGEVVIGFDLVMYAARSSGELVGMWNRIGAETSGWATEGGNHQRTRRRQ